MTRPAETGVVSETLAAIIAGEGVTDAFVLLGSSNYRVAHHLDDRHGVRLRHVRHESAGVAAADGYARVSGQVGFCSVTGGPGFTNTLTPLVTALKAHSPLVMLTGSTAGVSGRVRPFGVNMALDPMPVLDGAGVPAVSVRAASLHHDVADAFSRARNERTPVVLVLPSVEEALAVGDGPARRTERRASRSAPDVSAAVELLADAERPLVLAGFGAVEAGAEVELAALAEHIGALEATTLRARGLFRDEFDLGIAGGFAEPAAAAVMQRADVVLAFGASLNHFTTKKGGLFSGARVAQVDIDPRARGRHEEVDVFVAGDVAAVASAMLEALRRRFPPRVCWRRAETVHEARTAPLEPFEDAGQDGRIDPRVLCQELDRRLPPSRTIVTDGGHFALFPIEHMRVREPRDLVWTLDFGATGGGLGAAIGAAVARPDQLTVLFIGDGGFMMTMGDLDTAVRGRVPLLVIVMNNEAYASEVSLFQRAGLPDHHARFDTPSLAGIACAMGAEGFEVGSVPDLEVALAGLDELGGPRVLDCRVPLVTPRTLSSL